MEDILKTVLEEVPKSPDFIVILLNIMRTVEDPKSRSAKMAEEISRDKDLSQSMLYIVNSPLYNFETKISSLEHAVTLMGTNAILRIAIATWLRRYQERELKGYGYSVRGLPLQALIGGFIAKDIASHHWTRDFEDLAFSASIARNIGKVALDFYVQINIQKIMEIVYKGKPFDVAEREILGTNHTELGYNVAKKWSFPEELCSPIRYLHHPSSAVNTDEKLMKLTFIVHISDVVTMLSGVSSGKDVLLYAFDRKTLSVLNISDSDVEGYIVKARKMAPIVEKYFFEDIIKKERPQT